MRRRHFEALAPVCPRCLNERGVEAPLKLARVDQEQGDHVLAGVLHCSDALCQLEFPIVDGVPILAADVRAYLQNSLHQLLAREDLPEGLEGILGDAAGPGSTYDTTRQHLSIYGQDHYGDWDPEPPAQQTGGIARIIESGLALLGDGAGELPVLDLGCSVGRGCLTLAAAGEGLVLGGDLNFSMVRLAQRMLVEGEVRYPDRRLGVAYGRRSFPRPELPGLERVDYWVLDALKPPFVPGRFGMVSAINLVDCVSSPLLLLAQMARQLTPGGGAIIASPYDWSTAATAMEHWLGGHSSRADHGGDSAAILRGVLAGQPLSEGGPGLAASAEAEVDWYLHLSARSTMHYRTHVVAARRTG